MASENVTMKMHWHYVHISTKEKKKEEPGADPDSSGWSCAGVVINTCWSDKQQEKRAGEIKRERE